MKRERDYKKVYKEFWKDLVETKGKLDKDKVMRELSDYEFILEQVPKVYDEVTGGMISKPNTYAFEVIGVFNEKFSYRGATYEDLRDILESKEMTDTEKLEEVKNYTSND